MVELLANNLVARIAFLVALFAIVMVLVQTVIRQLSRRSTVRKSLREIDSIGGTSLNRASLQERTDTAWSKLADRIEKSGLNLNDSSGDALRQKLIAAGYTSPAAPRLFTLIRLFLVLALPTIYVLVVAGSAEPVSLFKLYVIGFVLALAGLYLPNLFITAKADRRKEAITNGFPDCLDLMLVCVEAGLGLESAMDRVGREMTTSHPLVAELLSGATLQLRAGAQRDDALRRMGQSSGVDEIRSFVTLLIQSDKLGTSLSDTLRVYSDEMREKRRMRAEEKAHRLPVLISIPLVVCMLPVMVGVLMLPGVVRTMRVLLPALGSG
ncbi:type II secretion system F family protein [Tsuneonella suprasediminis]|uniref:Type II secretion system F family protein n=1 Tax=Tsuneonella suprasediminis TaxID=2306996 RepID=A0A419R257_9SPHN|nr:type II secretion system F family protein [Tsuneonella suprasediminis]RJX67889.1 type II secretion system F family protein [Tsuneonella suprasediminis]